MSLKAECDYHVLVKGCGHQGWSIDEAIICSQVEPNSNLSRVERSFSSVPARNSNIPPYFGEISLAIKHVPRNGSNVTNTNCGELHVWVKSMRNVAEYQLNSTMSMNTSRRFSMNNDNGISENRAPISTGFGGSKILSAIAQFGQNYPVARV